MNPIETLLLCWAAGLVLHRQGGELIVDGIQPDTPPELIDLLRQHKRELLALASEWPDNEVTR
ncbi:hypothetical protein ACO2Q2_09065 [Dyella sp. KRB-257]|uniref:hypothetical protein n=1 Tax=Dyella sp. KRB-257 TaxID=3400915 RepID=UPI003C04065A